MVRVDWHAYALSMHKQNPLRITKGNNSHRIGLLLLFFFCTKFSVCFAGFDEIPSSSVEYNKEKPKRHGRKDGRTDNVKTVYPPQTQFAGV